MSEIVEWILLILLAGLSGFIAYKKGYNFWPWLLGGSLVSIFALLFLPHVNNMAEDKKDASIQRGNAIGWCFMVASFVWGFAEGYFSK